MNGIFAKPLKGMRYRERTRILKLARSGRVIDDPDGARLVEELVQSELSPRETRSWLWQSALLVLIMALLFWLSRTDVIPGSGGLGMAVTWIVFSVWVRSRYRRTARSNGWDT